ncbi:MAG: hypothetical protein JRN20_07720 [Nitrososphaerota archaeon]|nr:hypothetical protein [Nitrososphaerota archaeon]
MRQRGIVYPWSSRDLLFPMHYQVTRFLAMVSYRIGNHVTTGSSMRAG